MRERLPYFDAKFLPYRPGELLLALVDTLFMLATFALTVVIVQYTDLPTSAIGMAKSLPIIFATFFVSFLIFRIFQIIWRYAGIREYLRLICACVASGGLFAIIDAFGSHFLVANMHFATYISYILFSTVVLTLSRLIYAVSFSHLRNMKSNTKLKRTLIIGAGYAASNIVNELRKDKGPLLPICLLDDDKKKIGRTIDKVPVVGRTSDLKEMVIKYHIDLIIFAIPSATEEKRKSLLAECLQTCCEVRILPYFGDLIYNSGVARQVREINIDDLLGRTPIQLKDDGVANYIRGKRVMVTGGGGSIGSELCRQVAKFKAECVVVIDIYENTTYEIQQELIRTYPDLVLYVEIASMTDYDQMDRLMERYAPDVIFHAAAHKHVPLMETNPEEAVKNNVYGTWNMARLADKYRVKKFVMISTDKAVNPTNVMGATKRFCEMIVQYMSDHSTSTEYASVRFGNVLGSHGSVIPLFREQILSGGPVTVTDSEIVRYFMTIPEAVLLVLQTSVYAHGGEVFVLDMGEPVRILTLAENMILMLGKQPYTEIQIEFTGLRPGEKLREELLMKEEGLQKTENEKIFIGKQIEVDEKKFMEQLEHMRTVAATNDKIAVVRLLSEIVDTYKPDVRYFAEALCPAPESEIKVDVVPPSSVVESVKVDEEDCAGK